MELRLKDPYAVVRDLPVRPSACCAQPLVSRQTIGLDPVASLFPFEAVSEFAIYE